MTSNTRRRNSTTPAQVRRPEVGAPHRRTRVLAFGMIAAMLVISGWLLHVQALDPDNLAEKAREGRMRTKELTAPRGRILDSSGEPLARTVERYIITGSPKAVREYERVQKDANGEPILGDNGKPRREIAGADGAAEDLAPILGLKESFLVSKLGDLGKDPVDNPSQYVRLAKEVTPETWRKIAALKIPGIHRETLLRRNYPAGALAGNVIGFLGKDENSTALAGIERAYDDRLRGKNGELQFEAGAQNHGIPTAFQKEIKPIPGKDVHTTLNRDIQWYAQEVVKATVRDADAQWGTIIVQDPKTFNILALAEYPTVDPNDVAASDEKDRGVRSISAVVEPGSTTKIVTAAMAVEEGTAEPMSQFTVPYRYVTANGQRFKDSETHEPLKRTLSGIIAESSNTGTVMVGEKSDSQTVHKYLTKFGFGQKTNVGLPGESAGLLQSPDKWDGARKYTVMFGQGFAATPMQTTQLYSIVANNGKKLPSRLVLPPQDDTDKANQDVPADAGEQVISEATAKSVQKMLESVVVDGTGSKAAIPGYRVAGKTGTAQVAVPGKGYNTTDYSSSFIGFAPADDPKLVVSAIVHLPRNGHYGGSVAGPAFRKVMTYALGSMRIPPSTTEPNLYPIDWK